MSHSPSSYPSYSLERPSVGTVSPYSPDPVVDGRPLEDGETVTFFEVVKGPRGPRRGRPLGFVVYQ